MRNNKKPFAQASLRNSERGFGLIEVVIAAAILSVVALGITTLVEDMLRVQRKGSAVSVINNLRANITSAVQNGQTWELNVANADATTGNPAMDCLRATTPLLTCATGLVTPLSLIRSDGKSIYNALEANHGFRFDGEPCNTYPSAICQLRWNLTWTATCPGAVTPCHDPNVTVNGALEYTPDSSGALPGGFNPALYSISIVRGAEAIRNDAVSVSYVLAGLAGEGGGCKAAWVPRKLNTVVADTGNNLLNKVGSAVSPANEVQLVAGTYNCRVQAPAFKNGGNRLRLVSKAGTMFPDVNSTGATASPAGGSATLLIETTLILNANTTFIVEQKCSASPADDGDGFGSIDDNWSLGAPVPGASGGYGDATYMTITCARTS